MFRHIAREKLVRKYFSGGTGGEIQGVLANHL